VAVTIAIPFYNAERFLIDAIRSVFAQTYQNWELLLIDDGSTDKSLEIARSVNDPRVRVISDGRNKKLAARLNEITNLAKYEYIARMDADDLMSPYRIEIQMNILESHPSIDLVSTALYSVKNDLTLVGYRGSNDSNVSFERLIKREVGILHASLLARKEWYKRNKYLESLNVCQDSDIWLRASKKGDLKIKILANPLYVYREEGNITAKKLLQAYKIERKVFSKYIDDHSYRTYYILRSHAKTMSVQYLDRFNHLKIFHRRRNRSLTNEQIDDYKNMIETIKSTKVAGIDL
jgi:glycosyltransferase involved in cell wall biosynthesis